MYVPVCYKTSNPKVPTSTLPKTSALRMEGSLSCLRYLCGLLTEPPLPITPQF